MVEQLRRAQADHGDFFRMRVPFAPPYFMVLDPEDLQRILTRDHRSFVKAQIQRELSEFLGDSLLIADGEVWRRRRKRVAPFFLRRAVASYGETMTRCAAERVETWADGQTRDMAEEMSTLTLEILGPCLFGDVPLERDLMIECLAEMVSYMRKPASVRGLGTPGNRKARLAIERIERSVDSMVAQRRAQLEAEGAAEDAKLDLISVLLHASEEEGELSPEQLRGELITFVFAGHETTALALTFALHLLATHPQQAARAYEETSQVLEGRPPTLDDVKALRFVDGVIHEAMRLYPPVVGVGREAAEDTELHGCPIPKGAQVVAACWAIQRDPRFFPDPDSFEPARWLDADARARRPKFAYAPFGGGPRVCIGEGFALAESVIVLATILQRFELEWPAKRPELPLRLSFTLRPAGPVPIRLRARSA